MLLPLKLIETKPENIYCTVLYQNTLGHDDKILEFFQNISVLVITSASRDCFALPIYLSILGIPLMGILTTKAALKLLLRPSILACKNPPILP